MTDDPEYVRLDKWLWSVRVFKTRADATEACRGSAIKVNEQSAKPATKIRIGDTLKIRKRGITLTLKVKGLIEKRVGAQKVQEFCTDETSPAERILQQERQINAKLYKNHTLRGRPSKKERRTLSRFKENNF
ncbi:MAG: S4 domain-containing protein [Verrucomicrobia bacterium]|jgi:ribosome-associated heat shock protein Hsp15|nr:S4 domain-containing protein [Verrucomicrobiota bacterium]